MTLRIRKSSVICELEAEGLKEMLKDSELTAGHRARAGERGKKTLQPFTHLPWLAERKVRQVKKKKERSQVRIWRHKWVQCI